MKITKLGHCCLLIEEGDFRILTDPGAWTIAQNHITNLDVVLITHEHADHLHIESVKKILFQNPQAKILTTRGVGNILEQQGISNTLLCHGDFVRFKDSLIEGFGKKHAEIYVGIVPVDNTGYRIAEKFFFPGDAFYLPGKPVEILALPVCGPWMKISEAIDYAKTLKPRICFPVHDGMLGITSPFYNHPKRFLAEVGIEFVVPEIGKEMEF